MESTICDSAVSVTYRPSVDIQPDRILNGRHVMVECNFVVIAIFASFRLLVRTTLWITVPVTECNRCNRVFLFATYFSYYQLT